MSLLSISDYPDWILNNSNVEISNGKIKLYHYGDTEGTGILDPKFFGKSSYTSDVKQWSKPRVMFYINPNDKEQRVKGKEYIIWYPLEKLYPFNSDPLYYYEECAKEYENNNLSINIQLSCIGDKAEKNGFDGMILKWENTLRVDIWKPVKVNEKINESEIRNIIKEQLIIETSLNRIMQHMENYDIAIITAFRNKNSMCHIKNNDELNHEYSKEENLNRNRELHSSLISLGYGVTKAKGGYIENYGTLEQRKPVTENSYFVVNLNNDSDFIKNIFKLGEYFCQDAVLIKEKNKDTAYLLGTNNSEDIGYNNKIEIGKWHPKLKTEFFTSLNGNKVFTFESLLITKKYLNNITKGYVDKVRKKILN